MQIMMGVDAEQQSEMEMMIRELEAENRYFTVKINFYMLCCTFVADWWTLMLMRHCLFMIGRLCDES